MKPKILAVVILLIFSFGATSASSYRLSYTPRISVVETYTDNLFLDEDDEDDDFVTVAAAGLDLAAIWQTSGIELAFEPGYAFYQDNSDLNSLRLQGRLSAYTRLTQRSRLQFRNNTIRTEDPLPVRDIEDIRRPTSLIPLDRTFRRGREPYLRSASNLNYAYQFGDRDTFNVGCRYAFLDNDDPDRQDNQRYGLNTDLTYWLTPSWSAFGDARYTRALFDGNSSDFNNVNGILRLTHRTTRHFNWFFQYDHIWRDFDDPRIVRVDNELVSQGDFHLLSPSAGFNWQVTEDVPFALRVGYFYRQFDSGGSDDGPIFEVDLGSTWEFKRSAVYFNGGTGYRFANFGAQDLGFELFGETLVSANYFFTRRIRGDILAGFRRSEFKDTRDNRKDNVFRTGAALTFQLLPWMYLRTAYIFRTQDSTDSSVNYTENRGVIQITFRPERPWRSIR